MKRRTVVSAACLLAMAAGHEAGAQDAAPIELRCATGAVAQSLAGQQIARWADAVARESHGAVTLQVFYGGQLGTDVDIVQRVARGRIEVGGVSAAFVSLLVPELQLLALPMFFRSAQQLDCVLDGGLTSAVAERLAAKGVHFLGWGGSVTLDLVGKRAFTQPADLAGSKAGTYGSRVGAMIWDTLHANATPTGSAEIVAAFQTGLIDVAVSALTYYVPSGLNRVAPVMSRAELFFMPTMQIMNQAAWDRLGAERQVALDRARVPMAELRQQVRAYEMQMREAHLKGGGQLVDLDAAQREAFRHALEPVWPQMAQEAGPEGPRFLERLRGARDSCPHR